MIKPGQIIELDSPISGWTAYKIHYLACNEDYKNEQQIERCSGCGADDPINQNGKIICSYCKGILKTSSKEFKENYHFIPATKGINRQFFEYGLFSNTDYWRV